MTERRLTVRIGLPLSLPYPIEIFLFVDRSRGGYTVSRLRKEYTIVARVVSKAIFRLPLWFA